MILFLITYPLSPKMKPIHTVYANVSKHPPLLLFALLNFVYFVFYVGLVMPVPTKCTFNRLAASRI